MQDEQQQRFTAMQDLVASAKQSVEDLAELASRTLTYVDHDSSRQAEQLQRMQETAGRAVRLLTELTDLARHARSFQAQEHQRHHKEQVPQ